MKLENQVCSPEQGRKLKQLGIIGEAIFAWVSVCYDPTGEKDPAIQVICCGDNDSIPAKHGEYLAPAFNAAEMGLMLPPGMVTWFDGDHWHCSDGTENPFHMIGATEADAKANELISRIEAGWITIEEVNKRLQNT